MRVDYRCINKSVGTRWTGGRGSRLKLMLRGKIQSCEFL